MRRSQNAQHRAAVCGAKCSGSGVRWKAQNSRDYTGLKCRGPTIIHRGNPRIACLPACDGNKKPRSAESDPVRGLAGDGWGGPFCGGEVGGLVSETLPGSVPEMASRAGTISPTPPTEH